VNARFACGKVLAHDQFLITTAIDYPIQDPPRARSAIEMRETLVDKPARARSPAAACYSRNRHRPGQYSGARPV